MKVLLAGATGALGRALVPRLVAGGHEVVGLTRRPEKVAALEAAGARGEVCDVVDRDRVLALAEDVRPDVVLDETTDLPQRYDTRRMRGFYDGMADLRLRGTPNLLDAAEATGARPIFQSLAFIYRPDAVADGRPRTEDDPVFGADAPAPWNLALPATTALEQRTVSLGGLVLRYGFFYGPGTHYDRGGQAYEDTARRRFPLVGPATGVCSFIHLDDAAAATVLAVERPDARGILNIVDDEPMALRDWLPLYARAIGARPPRCVPLWLARMVSGPLPMHFATTMPPASNARAREVLGWAPAHPSVRDGFAGN